MIPVSTFGVNYQCRSLENDWQIQSMSLTITLLFGALRLHLIVNLARSQDLFQCNGNGELHINEEGLVPVFTETVKQLRESL